MDSRPNANPSAFRRILPARLAPSGAVATDTAAAGAQTASRLVVEPRRVNVTTACNACRKLKAKCSGHRPRCASCVKRQTQCEYETDPDETTSKALKRKYEELKSHKTPYERVFDALRSRPEADVGPILRKIRSGEPIDDIAREIEYGDLLLQSAVVPETRYRYEFPISSRMPPYLLLSSNRYLDSLIYDWAAPLPTREAASGRIASQKQPTVAATEFYAPYLKPYHAAEVVDVQLGAVAPSKWTLVCSDDVLMRRLLNAFFLQDHDWWTAFQKDYFLEDMSHMRHQLCSSLLVNTVLALSCNYYRGIADRDEFWNPRTLGYRFLAEAKRLWEYEMHKNNLTTIQAALLLHVIYSGTGADKIGFAYMTQSCAMAHAIGLFTSNNTVESNRIRDAKNYTAWALYSWQSLMCFHYFRPPQFKQPPEFALPDPEQNPHWYGELWLKYPRNKTLYPSNSGDVFKAKAEFAIILNEIAERLFGGTLPTRDLPAVEIGEFYTRFQTWYNSLPESLSPRRVVLPSHLKVHMHYFQVLLRLLQSPSILNEDGSDGRAIALDMLGESPPLKIVSDAKSSLETLLRAYYLRHGFAYLDTYLVSLLMETCLGAIDAAAMENSRGDDTAMLPTIILLAKGIYEQGQNFFLGQMVFQLVKSKIGPRTLSMLEHFIKMEPIGEKQSAGHQHIQMDWPVQIISMADDPESKRLQRLLEDPNKTPQ